MIPRLDLVDPKITLPIFGLGFAATIVFLAFAIPAEEARKAALQARHERALEMWLTECQAHNPIQSCAYAWDNSGTLRGIYFDKAE